MGVHPFIGLEKYGSRTTQNAGRSGEVAELVKPLAMSQPNDLSLIFGTQVLKRENSKKIVFWLHACTAVYTHTETQTHTIPTYVHIQ